jgi:competence protein ComEC
MIAIKHDLENKNNKWAKWVVLGLVFVNLFVWLAVWWNAQRRDLEVTFFDVGQGDAAFAQLPNGVQVLFDGGPDAGVLEKLGQAMPFYDRDIDWVVLSHTDRDHLAGLISVLKNYRVRNIIWSGISDEDAEDTEWNRLVAQEGADVVLASFGEKFALGNAQDCFLEILSPAAGAPASGQSQNELSVAVKLTYGARSFLFTGDAPDGADTARLAGNADILKVAHHGSKYSTSGAFLANLLPAAAVISAGRNNSYGHPSPQVLEMLSKYDIKTLRTDQNGDISIRTNGESLFVKTEK